jgi:hypothetical protein
MVPNGDGVGDWRVFIYREYGLKSKGICPAGPTPIFPRVPPIYDLPPEADLPGCLRGPWPSCMNWLFCFRKPRYDQVYEFFFGDDHYLKNEDTYLIALDTEVSNRTYVILAWFGLLGFVLGAINLAINFWRFFRRI